MPQPKSSTTSRSTPRGGTAKAPARGAKATASGAAAAKPKTAAKPRSAAGKPKAAAAKPAASKRATAARATRSTASGKPAAKKASATPVAKPAASRSTTAKPAASRSTSAKPAASRSTTAKRRTSSASKPAARRTAAKPATRRSKPAATSPRQAAASSSAPGTDAARDEALKANLGALRELLAGGVVLTAQRVQESLDDAVKRGRMTRRDAEDLARGLLDAGRRQSADILADVEQLLGRSRDELTSASSRVIEQAGDSSDRVLREVDRVRRGAGVGPSFPILNYAELTTAKIVKRLDDLTAPQLRKVRDLERRTDKRKTVLDAIERKLK